jgi:hypothetical protein
LTYSERMLIFVIMNDETKKDRSPNCPKISLEEAVKMTRQLYEKAGKAKMKRVAACGALGYAGLTGSSLTMLGALNQYGLIDLDREAGGVSVSPLAIKIMHPTSKEESRFSLTESALNPRVFRVLYTEGFHHCEESVLANNLVQQGFTPDTARKVASVYLSNIKFAELDSDSIRGPSDAKKEEIKRSLESSTGQIHSISKEIIQSERPPETSQSNKKLLAQYSIPIGASEATLIFTGEKLTVEDFDALADYVSIFKKQFERKQKAERTNPQWPEPPFVALWKGSNFEKMVKIISVLGEENGEIVYKDADGTSIPAQELFPDRQK